METVYLLVANDGDLHI